MPANTSPIFPLRPKISWNTAAITAANTNMQGTGTAIEVTPAMGVDGARVDQIIVRPLGTNVATVMRFFVNNGGVNSTATNNTLVHEVALAATTASNVAALAGVDVAIAKDEGQFECPIKYLPPGHKILVTIGTAVAAGFAVSVHYGEY
jgi:hypothetical protein